MALLKQSTIYTRLFLLVQSGDHVSALNGATAAVTISKAGAAFGAAAGAVSEVANGWYKIALTTVDTGTVGDLAFHVTATGADPTDFVDQVSAAVDQTGDNFARLGAPAGASLAADVAAVKADSGAIKTKTDSLTFTVAGQVDSNVLDWKSATAPAMTGDSFARLGAPAGASVSADVAAVKAVLPAALVGGRIDASVGAVASGVIAAASFAANALDAVWSTTTRLLSAGTNIVLAKGTGVTGFNDLDASGIRAAAGLATANLDTQLSAINTKTTNLPAAPADESLIIAATNALATSIAALPTANSNADALLDRANGIETGWTLRQVLRISFSVLAGRGYGLAGTAARFRDAADTKNRVSAVINSSGDRTVTLDAS